MFLFCMFSFPCPWTYKFPLIPSFFRPGPHHVEWSLHSRENRYPVDSAQWGLLLCCPVSRWLNSLGTFIYSSSCAFLSQGIRLAHFSVSLWLWGGWNNGISLSAENFASVRVKTALLCFKCRVTASHEVTRTLALSLYIVLLSIIDLT